MTLSIVKIRRFAQVKIWTDRAEKQGMDYGMDYGECRRRHACKFQTTQRTNAGRKPMNLATSLSDEWSHGQQQKVAHISHVLDESIKSEELEKNKQTKNNCTYVDIESWLSKFSFIFQILINAKVIQNWCMC